MKATPAFKLEPAGQEKPIAAAVVAPVEPDVVGTVNVAVTQSKET